jgi:hypothetical protein
MSALFGLSMMLLLAASCAAQQSISADLARKADQASGKECARLSIQTARQSLADASKLFDGGQGQAAHSAIDVSLHYAQRSVDCSLRAHKSERSLEIDLRELIRRLNDLRHAVDLDDQPHLAESVLGLEKQRDRLLSAMFGPVASGALETKP